MIDTKNKQTEDKDFDLICIGRSCVDLYSSEVGAPLERAMTFDKYVGGSPMNIAIGTSRLGLRVGAITAVGQEDNGRYLKWELACEGVDTSAVKTDPERLTAMVLLSIRGNNDFPLIQYRENCADMGLEPDDIDPEYLARARAVLVTGTHLSREGVRATTMKILETARERGIRCILDLDYRPNLWGLQGHDAGSSRWATASERITREYRKVLPYFDLIVGTEEEFFIAGGKTEPMAALREVRKLSRALLVFKLGDRGCAALPGEIPDSFDEVTYPGFPVNVFNSIGAGDGFMSGFLRGWLRDEDLAVCCRYANAAGAFAVSRLGCSPSYPSWIELNHFLEHGSEHKWLRKDTVLEQIHWSTNRRRHWHDLTVFALDHREAFESLAKRTGKEGNDIAAFKMLAFRAAELVSRDLPEQEIGVLLDDIYARNLLFETNHHPFWVGRAVEIPGSNPLGFEGQADIGMTLATWPENHVIKCLFRPGANDGDAVRAENERQLRILFSAARGTGHELLLELLVQGADSAESHDACLLGWMQRCYELGVFPDYWKLLPIASPETWKRVEQLLESNDPYCCGVLFLGCNMEEDELAQLLTRAPRTRRALGFAVGRTIFMRAAEGWFSGTMSDEEAVEAMRSSFKRLIDSWKRRP